MKNRLIQIAVFLVIAKAGTAVSGEYHADGRMTCSDCHTTHYSEQGQPPAESEPGGPFPGLLRASSTNILCLSCHDGSDPTAPDVLGPVTMYDGSGSEYSAAGYFQEINAQGVPYNHDLGVFNMIPYSSPSRGMVLSCAGCHNPHGNSNYRNLQPDPDSSGAGTSIILDSDIYEEFRPSDPPIRESTIRAYRSGNIGYKGNMSAWCVECHNGLLPNSSGNMPAHFQRHPNDVDLSQTGYHVDPAHWTDGSGEGFGIGTGDIIEGIPRLRFSNPDAIDFGTSHFVSEGNRVFCLTCHQAHGGEYESNLIWPFKTANSPDMYSGCQQCHYK